MMKKSRGFTLIELVICIGILSILLSIANINLNVRDKIEAKEQLKTMALDIKQLKNYSQVNNCRTSIKINNDGYILNFLGKSRHVKFNKLVKLKSTNVRVINFTTEGKPSFLANKNSAGTINYTINDKKTVKITIQPVTGKVSYDEFKN
ncbi:type II secretion system protein [Peptoniphilus faecalis]|nr:type II secretion system protein [Peptoniphilus faecalis]